MIISENDKFIFIHIPKNGGTSVALSLEEHLKYNDIVIGGTKYGEKLLQIYQKQFGVSKHSLGIEIQDLVGKEKWEQFFTFGVVRNPYRRIVSIYTYSEKKLSSFFGTGILHHSNKETLAHIPQRIKSQIKYLGAKVNSQYFKNTLWLLKWPDIKAYLDTANFSEFIRHPFLMKDNSFRTQWTWLSDRDRQNLIVDRVIKLEEIESEWPKLCQDLGISCKLKFENKSASRSVELTPEDRSYIYSQFKIDFDKFGYLP
ncbi:MULTISPECIES: sulfotransferase family 2 domain-containing protein [Okeania]|uniref:Sulfotransferase family protein n=1 Tax=Okeania hirsuta TaxID=1458930 RepID=A0A3N6NZ59_9CYAN|nr:MULTISPECIES: sulfotransferase family 2 domain-containing protein [Okeania]NET79639.1 sulfotransferase family protein [Okeania sp. SIO1F9]RQH05961.1 hypothetical protein D4Z78_30410 [Okeania hirsuta]RQH24217.1 hypothetical protein D5R40_29970 [Okeania hirsuta]